VLQSVAVCSYDRAGFGWSEIGMCCIVRCAIYCRLLPSVAVCCSLLQSVAEYFCAIVWVLHGVRLVLVRVAVCVVQPIAASCSMLQSDAVGLSWLQCIAVCSFDFACVGRSEIGK